MSYRPWNKVELIIIKDKIYKKYFAFYWEFIEAKKFIF